ncbi:hypothetical protein [Humidesulfovibrio idahonensis]
MTLSIGRTGDDHHRSVMRWIAVMRRDNNGIFADKLMREDEV